MIIFVSVKLKELFKKERDYPWTRPESCPRCNDYKVCEIGDVHWIITFLLILLNSLIGHR